MLRCMRRRCHAREQAMHRSANVHRLLAAACFALAGCGATALAGEAQPLIATIESIIVPNSADAWVCDAEWDEYLIRIRAPSNDPVQIREIAIFDRFDQR